MCNAEDFSVAEKRLQIFTGHFFHCLMPRLFCTKRATRPKMIFHGRGLATHKPILKWSLVLPFSGIKLGWFYHFLVLLSKWRTTTPDFSLKSTEIQHPFVDSIKFRLYGPKQGQITINSFSVIHFAHCFVSEGQENRV